MAIRLGGALKELRIHLCQTSKASEGVREFIKNRYVELKKANPEFPILIRECSGVEARVWARYEALKEVSHCLEYKDEFDIHGIINELATLKEQKKLSQPITSKLLTS